MVKAWLIPVIHQKYKYDSGIIHLHFRFEDGYIMEHWSNQKPARHSTTSGCDDCTWLRQLISFET
ncbi:MAG TPA: hypothetical protein VEP90_29905, partial [Methylomirabilota bacterium]|nr:hypothetical protein [Methylomirabilota bacterium]